MTKKKVRTVERQRVKKNGDVTQTTSVNIKIVPEALRPKKKKKRKGPSKKKKVIAQIKEALGELQKLKQMAKEKGIQIPAELGELPQDADSMKTLEQLQGLLATLKGRNVKISDIVRGQGQSESVADQISRTRTNIFNEQSGNPFGGSTFPAQYRLPREGLQPQMPPVIINPQGQALPAPPVNPALPAPPVRPAIMPPDPDSRVVKPPQGASGARDQKLIMDQIASLKKDIEDKLKEQLKAKKITEKEYKDKLAQAQVRATMKERATMKAVMGPYANTDYADIMTHISAFRTKVNSFKGTTITGDQANDIKDMAHGALIRIAEFKGKYPELVEEHPELFEFREQMEYLSQDPVMMVASEQGVAVKETGMIKATEHELKERIEDLNQNTQQLQSDWDNLKQRQRQSGETMSPAEVRGLKKQADNLKRAEKAIDDIIAKQGPISGDIRLLTEPENLKQKLTTLFNEIERMSRPLPPTPAKPVVDMGKQKAIWRLLAYTATVNPIGAEYDKSTFMADLGKINYDMRNSSQFGKMPDNSSVQISNVTSGIDNFLSVNDGFSREFEGKDYKVGKGGTPAGGGQRRMIPSPMIQSIGHGARLGSELEEVHFF
jgi:hypothetical protein